MQTMSAMSGPGYINRLPVVLPQSGSAILFADSFVVDAFSRLRVSNPQTLFDSKQLTSDASYYFWSDMEMSGAATSTIYNPGRASTSISVSSGIAGARFRQTKRCFSYQPGKSQLMLATFILGSGVSGITKRVGYFNDEDGLYLELANTTLNLVRRTSTSGSIMHEVVPQSSWNIDKLDGTGQSEFRLDTTKTQIFALDFEWLGVGRVRFGFVIDGIYVAVHEMLHANVLNSVYMATPNNPVKYEIWNNGSGPSSSLECICSTVISEGGQQDPGFTNVIDRRDLSLTTLNNNGVYPLLACRLKSTHHHATVIPESVSVLCTSTSAYRWLLYINPTWIGGTPTYSGLANSVVDVATTIPNTITCFVGSGLRIAGGYDSQAGGAALNANITNSIRIGHDASGVADELVLAVQRLSNQAETFYGSITIREIN